MTVFKSTEVTVGHLHRDVLEVIAVDQLLQSDLAAVVRGVIIRLQGKTLFQISNLINNQRIFNIVDILDIKRSPWLDTFC